MKKEAVLLTLVFLVLLNGCAEQKVEEQTNVFEESSGTDAEIEKKSPSNATLSDEERTITGNESISKNLSADSKTDGFVKSSAEITAESEIKPPVATELFLPTITYPGAYNGPLYATSEQIGDSAPLTHINNLQRNGVNFMIAFFGIDFEDLDEDLNFAAEFTQANPNRIIPFFSPGFSSSETKPLIGEKLTSLYKDTLAAVQKEKGKDFIKGFGEIELYAWDIQPNDPKMLQLFDLAAKNNLAVMFHPDQGQTAAVKEVIERYPDTTFLIHMFPEDFDRDRQSYINILKTHNNIYFSVDADHMMYDGRTGLLYKYENEATTTAVQHFISDYDRNEQRLLDSAINRYKPLIEAVPDKVMWGTEGGTDYFYEPDVYDRLIKFTRVFIGKLKPEIQEKFAYKNAVNAFGEGET